MPHSCCVCMQVQVDVEGCELQALQGIQDHHWPHLRQVLVSYFYCLMVYPVSRTVRKEACTCCNLSCMPGSNLSLSCFACMHMCIVADKISLANVPASLSACPAACKGSSTCMQIILEVHDTRGRREHVIQLLKAQNYLVSCVRGLAPETYLVYARRT